MVRIEVKVSFYLPRSSSFKTVRVHYEYLLAIIHEMVLILTKSWESYDPTVPITCYNTAFMTNSWHSVTIDFGRAWLIDSSARGSVSLDLRNEKRTNNLSCTRLT